MTKDEALLMALEAMESVTVECNNFHHPKKDQNHHWAKCPPIVRWDKAITAIKEALAQPKQEPANKYCCHLCFNKSGQLFLDRMILCPECGNKRCPKATHHELPCTNSNEPNQAGSVYTASPHRTWVGLADEEIDLVCVGLWSGGWRKKAMQDFARAIEAKLKEKNTRQDGECKYCTHGCHACDARRQSNVLP